MLKSNIVDNVLNWAKFKADQQLNNNDCTKRTLFVPLPYIPLALPSLRLRAMGWQLDRSSEARGRQQRRDTLG